MVMHSGKSDFNATRNPLFQAVQTSEATAKLINAELDEDFLTVLNFMDEQEATDFALCIFKCRKHGLWEQEKRFWLIAKARVAVKGRRSELYGQVLARLLVPGFFPGGKHDGEVQSGKPSNPNV